MKARKAAQAPKGPSQGPVASEKTTKEVQMDMEHVVCMFVCMYVLIIMFQVNSPILNISQLLGELYADRQYLEKLLKDPSETSFYNRLV